MHKKFRYSSVFSYLFILLVTLYACTSKSEITVNDVLTPTTVVATETSHPHAAEITTAYANWPIYTLETEFPDAPEKMRLYMQAFPAGLPDEEGLNALMTQLKITGTIATRESEAGNTVIDVSGEAGSFTVTSVDPLIIHLRTQEFEQIDGSAPTKTFLSDELAKTAEDFLKERNLLDFPYTMESPRSRMRDSTIAVVPLIDEYPLFDIDPLNGRLLVWFNSAGEVSLVFWRPLKLIANEFVSIQPASVSWENFVSGKLPNGNGIGQCYHIVISDSKESDGKDIFKYSPSCFNFYSLSEFPYNAATITEIKLVYFADDLYLGMSPFAFPADSPVRFVIPMWQFSGTTSDNRDVIVLWPAMYPP